MPGHSSGDSLLAIPRAISRKFLGRARTRAIFMAAGFLQTAAQANGVPGGPGPDDTIREIQEKIRQVISQGPALAPLTLENTNAESPPSYPSRQDFPLDSLPMKQDDAVRIKRQGFWAGASEMGFQTLRWTVSLLGSAGSPRNFGRKTPRLFL
jgi:hypothetical protein